LPGASQRYLGVRRVRDAFADLPLFGLDLVIADPPWLFALRSSAGEEKSPQAQYDCMTLEAIKALPVGHLVGCDSWLLLWATAPLLPQAIEVMHAWGFQYRTRFAWRKTTARGKVRMGPGYVVRTMHEDILVGAIGQPSYARAFPSIFDGLAREHSRKPDAFYHLVERFAPAARRVDLFSRQSRPGFTSWRNEAHKFDEVAA
jgi:N6-adenosine-specific RNA methylase IME4